MTTTARRPAPIAVAAPGKPGHRRDIEGLRAIAVLLVVLYHCGVPFLPGGYVGVDVFFVISGFLITTLLLQERAATGRISIAGFYARRARRLLPAATVVTAATVAAAYLWLPPLRVPRIAFDALAASVYGINYRLAATGADYLNADAAPSPLQHFWSLAVEEQFYLVWPLALALGMRRRLLSTVVAVSLVLSIQQTAASPTWAYFGAHTRAWELGAGALVAMLGPRRLLCSPIRTTRRRRPNPSLLCLPIRTTLAAAGLGAILAGAVVFSDRTPFPGYAALLPVAGTVAVLLSRPDTLLGARPLRVIGRLSYSWYLWHWPFLAIGPAALGVPAGLAVNLALAAGALLAAAATYALVENPVRRTRVPLAAGLAVTVLATTGYLALGLVPPRTGSGYRAPPLNGPPTLALGHPAPAVPDNLTPSLATATADQPRLYRDGCSSGFTDATIHKPCVYGDAASSTTVVLFGDSHAGAWFPAVDAVARQRGWRLVVVTKSACSAASVRIFQAKLNRPFDECVRWRESAWDYIASLHPALVVMSSAAAGGALADPTADPDSTWIRGWTRTADRLTATGARLYLIEDTPYQPGDVPECLSAHRPAACQTPASTAFPDPARRAAIRAAVRARGVTTIDPAPWFCTATVCPVVVGNVLVYRDASHVTATYSRLLAPLLSPYLNP